VDAADLVHKCGGGDLMGPIWAWLGLNRAWCYACPFLFLSSRMQGSWLPMVDHANVFTTGDMGMPFGYSRISILGSAH
jgi:hypothetical protein